MAISCQFNGNTLYALNFMDDQLFIEGHISIDLIYDYICSYPVHSWNKSHVTRVTESNNMQWGLL